MEDVVASACIAFFVLNFLMFMSVWSTGWEWRGIITIGIIDFFFVLLVCLGLYLILVL